jgi:hypothetical protein
MVVEFREKTTIGGRKQLLQATKPSDLDKK